MTEEYVEEDNIKFLLTYHSNCLATTFIPIFFNEELQSNSILNLNASTLKNYLSKSILMFQVSVNDRRTTWVIDVRSPCIKYAGHA